MTELQYDESGHLTEHSRELLKKVLKDPHYVVEIKHWPCEHFRQTIMENGKLVDVCSRCLQILPGGMWDE